MQDHPSAPGTTTVLWGAEPPLADDDLLDSRGPHLMKPLCVFHRNSVFFTEEIIDPYSAGFPNGSYFNRDDGGELISIPGWRRPHGTVLGGGLLSY